MNVFIIEEMTKMKLWLNENDSMQNEISRMKFQINIISHTRYVFFHLSRIVMQFLYMLGLLKPGLNVQSEFRNRFSVNNIL